MALLHLQLPQAHPAVAAQARWAGRCCACVCWLAGCLLGLAVAGCIHHQREWVDPHWLELLHLLLHGGRKLPCCAFRHLDSSRSNLKQQHV